METREKKMDNKMSAIRHYYSELVQACFEKRQPLPIPEGLEVKELLSYAAKGQIYYPIASSLIKLDLQEEVTEKIRNILKSSTYKTLMQMVLGNEISKAFEKEGIRHQLLKGAVIKKDYPSPEMREMSDIDLVVYDESLDKAAAILEKMGFDNRGLIKHHMIFTKKPHLCVEVHWCLFDENVGQSQHMYFKDFRAKIKDGTQYTYEFSHEDFYVYMIAHMAKHFFETGCGIRNLMDIYIYRNKYGKEMDEKYLSQELKKSGLLDFEEHMRELAYIWLDDKDCSEFYENLFAYMVDSGIYGKNENGIWGQLAKETQHSENAKLHYYFPSYSFMKEKYKWLENKALLLPVAWIIRGFNAARSDEAKRHREVFNSADKDNTEKMLEMYHKLNLNFRR
jgi:hypothetical protein